MRMRMNLWRHTYTHTHTVMRSRLHREHLRVDPHPPLSLSLLLHGRSCIILTALLFVSLSPPPLSPLPSLPPPLSPAEHPGVYHHVCLRDDRGGQRCRLFPSRDLHHRRRRVVRFDEGSCEPASARRRWRRRRAAAGAVQGAPAMSECDKRASECTRCR